MKAKKIVLDQMIANGFKLKRPFFWYLETYSLEELKNLKSFVKKGWQITVKMIYYNHQEGHKNKQQKRGN